MPPAAPAKSHRVTLLADRTVSYTAILQLGQMEIHDLTRALRELAGVKGLRVPRPVSSLPWRVGDSYSEAEEGSELGGQDVGHQRGHERL